MKAFQIKLWKTTGSETIKTIIDQTLTEEVIMKSDMNEWEKINEKD